MADSEEKPGISRDTKIAIIGLILILALFAGAFVAIAYRAELATKRDMEEVIEVKRWAAAKLAAAAVAKQHLARKQNATNGNSNPKSD